LDHLCGSSHDVGPRGTWHFLLKLNPYTVTWLRYWI
jgi:hypothetical protein